MFDLGLTGMGWCEKDFSFPSPSFVLLTPTPLVEFCFSPPSSASKFQDGGQTCISITFRLQLRWPHRHFISWTNSCKEKKQREITSYFITFPRSFEVFSNGFLARARARTHVRVLSYYKVCGEYGKTRTRECRQYRHRRFNFWDGFSDKQINSLPSVLVYLRDWVFTVCSKELVEKTVK